MNKFARASVVMAIRAETYQIILHMALIFICAILLIYKCNYPSAKVIIIPLSAHPEFYHKTDIKASLFGPYNTTNVLVEDTHDQLIDIKNFSFITNPTVCQFYPAGLLLMVIVSSNPIHFKNREVIRNTWGKNIDSMKVVFLIGEMDNSSLANQIRDENDEFGDIVQGTFKDAYRNMTYKHVMGLKWVAHYCPTAKYILKTDDDVLVFSKELRRFLVKELSPWGATDLIAGQIVKNAEVIRRNTSKWMVTKTEYPDKYYPTYLSGWAILYSQDVVRRLLKVAQTESYFWVDDVYVAGEAAKKIEVVHTSLAKYVLNKAKAKELKAGSVWVNGEPLLFGWPNLSTDEILKLWTLVYNGTDAD